MVESQCASTASSLVGSVSSKMPATEEVPVNLDLLKQHIQQFKDDASRDPEKRLADERERQELVSFYQSFSVATVRKMSGDDLYEYLSQLWAMRIWGNKRYYIDKLVADNGLETLKDWIGRLLWGERDIADRWDTFRTEIKGIGPAMMSELLCKTHPHEFILWNRRAFVAFRYLEAPNLPRYDYQLTGSVYSDLCTVSKEIAAVMKEMGCDDTTLLAVDYLIWEKLQVEDNLSKIGQAKPEVRIADNKNSGNVTKFAHNDIRDKIRDIGHWLGFTANIEQRVSDGSRVDAVWESTIGNMGRVIYVFEVQAKGSTDSLILNLLKSLNNPAVQGVVAVSDRAQLDKIQKHAKGVKDLRDKLKYWDYEEVSQVHESLAYVNGAINGLGLVPEGF